MLTINTDGRFQAEILGNQTTAATCKKSVDLFCIIFKLELEHDISKVLPSFRVFFSYGLKKFGRKLKDIFSLSCRCFANLHSVLLDERCYFQMRHDFVPLEMALLLNVQSQSFSRCL